MCWSLPYFTFLDTVVQHARGTNWAAKDIRETAVIILLFTMVPGLFALYRTLSNRMLGRAEENLLEGGAAAHRRK